MVRPLPSYAGSFHPFPGELVAGVRVAPDGCIKPSEAALMLAGREESAAAIAALVGVSRQLVNMWESGGRFPNDTARQVMADRLGIPVEAWGWWRPAGAAGSEEKPALRPRGGEAPADVPAIPDSGTVEERARALLAYLLSVDGLTTAQAARVREVRQTLALLAKPRPMPLHEHPDFEAWADRLVTGLAGVPGALEVLERNLGTPEEGSAAA